MLIRHGETAGNQKQRYIGRRTDEPLLPQSQEVLKQLDYGEPQAVYASPMLRCTQTASILVPGKPRNIIDELAECDFGEFENKNYKELDGNADYQAWVDSKGMLPFPGGESREEAKRRNLTGFDKAVTRCIRRGISQAALVIHGGTIMNIMEEYAQIPRSFYEWHVKNGGGYEVELDENLWQKNRKELILKSSVMEG